MRQYMKSINERAQEILVKAKDLDPRDRARLVTVARQAVTGKDAEYLIADLLDRDSAAEDSAAEPIKNEEAKNEVAKKLQKTNKLNLRGKFDGKKEAK